MIGWIQNALQAYLELCFLDDAFQYVNCCQYKWAFDIFQNIQSLDYEYVMDYGDIYELSFQELFENDLVDISIQKYSLYNYQYKVYCQQ